MGDTKQVLLVANAATDAELEEIKQSILRAEQHGLKIKLSIVHVIPTLPTCYFNIPSMVHLAERYYEEAKENLHRIGTMLNIAQKDQWLISGRIRAEVLRLANKLNSSFILASSASLRDLHKTFIFHRQPRNTPIKGFNHIGVALNK